MFLAVGRICAVVLVGVVTMGMAIPGSHVAFSQSSTGTVAQPPLLTALLR